MNEQSLFIGTNILIYLIDSSKAFRGLAEVLHQMQVFISVVSEIEILSFTGLNIDVEVIIKSMLDDLSLWILYSSETAHN